MKKTNLESKKIKNLIKKNLNFKKLDELIEKQEKFMENKKVRMFFVPNIGLVRYIEDK